MTALERMMGVRPQGDPAARALTTQEVAQQIDKQFDAMLYEGMPSEQVFHVEQQRAAAHQRLLSALLGRR